MFHPSHSHFDIFLYLFTLNIEKMIQGFCKRAGKKRIALLFIAQKQISGKGWDLLIGATRIGF